MSPASQNEFIGIVAKFIIQIRLSEEIKEVKFPSIYETMMTDCAIKDST